MIGARNERLGIADNDVEPMEQARIGIVGLVFMRKLFQRRNIAAITVAADHTVFCKGGLGKFSDRSLFDGG